MVFSPKPPQISQGQDVYIKEPDRTDRQYKARVMFLDPLILGVWPNADQEPNFATLNEMYQINCQEAGLTTADLSAIPYMDGRQVTGYWQALQEAGYSAPEWEMAAAPEAVPTGTPPAQQALPLASSQPAPAAEASAPATPPSDVPPFKEGDTVEVAPTDDGYWGQLVGKQGKVMALTEGGFVSVNIDGHIYPDVLHSRFRLTQEQAKPAPEAQSQQAEAQSRVMTYLGKEVQITDAINGNPYRGKITKEATDGVWLEGFDSPVPWERVGEVALMEETPIPGNKKDAEHIEKKQVDQAADVSSILDDISAILKAEKVVAKETLGKRDYRKLMDRYELLLTKLTDFNPPQLEGSGASADEVARAQKAGHEQGWTEACAEMQNELNRMTAE